MIKAISGGDYSLLRRYFEGLSFNRNLENAYYGVLNRRDIPQAPSQARCHRLVNPHRPLFCAKRSLFLAFLFLAFNGGRFPLALSKTLLSLGNVFVARGVFANVVHTHHNQSHPTRLRDEGRLDRGQLPGDEDFEVDVYTVADTLKVTVLARPCLSR